jgi:hypothetical protein
VRGGGAFDLHACVNAAFVEGVFCGCVSCGWTGRMRSGLEQDACERGAALV